MMMVNWGQTRKTPECPFCNKNTRVKKHGFARSTLQRYHCSSCAKSFQTKYIYQLQRSRPVATN